MTNVVPIPISEPKRQFKIFQRGPWQKRREAADPVHTGVQCTVFALLGAAVSGA